MQRQRSKQRTPSLNGAGGSDTAEVESRMGQSLLPITPQKRVSNLSIGSEHSSIYAAYDSEGLVKEQRSSEIYEPMENTRAAITEAGSQAKPQLLSLTRSVRINWSVYMCAHWQRKNRAGLWFGKSQHT